MSVLFEAAIGFAVGKAGDLALDQVKLILKKGAAKKELGAIGASAVEAAILVEPGFSEDFRSQPFLEDVMAPVLLDMLANPGRTWESKAFADHYLERFVRPYLRGRSDAETLNRIYQTDVKTLQAAFVAFLDKVRASLFASTHWKEQVRDATLSEIREGMVSVRQALEVMTAPSSDPEQARRDAKTSSSALRDWTKDIFGEEIERAALPALLTRIASEPSGCTLLIGEAGVGKSALLAKLTAELEAEGTPVFALKADLLTPEVRDMEGLSRELGIKGRIDDEIRTLASEGPLVVLIDQLDAVSDVMDRTSQRMRLLLSLCKTARATPAGAPPLPVHIIVSSRPFEAAHDARFQSLKAKEVSLSPLSAVEVDAFLERMDVSAKTVSASLRDTLRRPFALRLFIELVRRGAAPENLAASDLLQAWLASAKIGDGAERLHAMTFLETLAGDMTDTETLWRPADRYEAEHRQALTACLANGLIIRQSDRIGFSHQAWLDDFQARRLATAETLTDYVWARQDGLFSRATALRALQRLRAHDERQYDLALDILLGQERTRRHIRHLVVDLVSTNPAPQPREQTWVYSLIQNDPPLGRRAAGGLVEHWSQWRGRLKPLLPRMMRHEALQWSAVRILQAEAEIAPVEVEALLQRYWGEEPFDGLVFEVCMRAALWSSTTEARLADAFGRKRIRDYDIDVYVSELIKQDRQNDAKALVRVFIQKAGAEALAEMDFDRLTALTETAAEDVAHVLMPWLLEMSAGSEDAVENRYKADYPRLPSASSGRLRRRDGIDGPFQMLRSALAAMAEAAPEAVMPFLMTAMAVEFDEVQALVADTLAAGIPTLLEEGLAFLLADPRRLQVGHAHLRDAEGVGRMVYGWSSQRLITTMAPHLGRTDAARLRDAIKAWDPYREVAWMESKGSGLRERLRWADELKMPLYEALPDTVIDARRRRQILEWRAQQPRYREEPEDMILTAVGSPMSTDQMVKATDQEIMGMFDAVDDSVDNLTSRRKRGRRRWPNSGGVSQLAQAFLGFAQREPERTFGILERLVPQRHAYVAGAALRALSENENVSPQRLLRVIRDLDDRGFSTRDWRRDASWAMQELAQRNEGLAPAEIDLLESWLQPFVPRSPNDPAYSPPEPAAENSDSRPARPVVFGHDMGGISIAPHGNYAHLTAILAGQICRKDPDYDGWLGVLSSHVETPEDPEVWSSILALRGRYLLGADRIGVRSFIDALWRKDPGVFDPPSMTHFTWSCRVLMPSAVTEAMLLRWMTSSDAALRQGAGEYAAALCLLGEASEVVSALHLLSLGVSDKAARTGAMFAAAAAWVQDDPDLRAAGHKLLTGAAAGATGAVAEAIANGLTRSSSLAPDAATRELLTLACDNRDLLAAALNSRLMNALQELLIHPGFDEIVLQCMERSLDRFDEGGQRRGAFIDKDMVEISVALQRTDGPIRVRAMNLYERLLDADVYGADKAARAALRQ